MWIAGYQINQTALDTYLARCYFEKVSK